MALKTKFGNARISNSGYYWITSRKEGNANKYLHRLIYEEFYGEIPNGYDIHHKNGNKLDNCILNLELIRHNEHASAHHKNKKVSQETIEKRRQSMIKKYARIVKDGSKNGKQNYCIKFNRKKIKQSTDEKKLLDWFLKEYSLEIIKVGV